MQFRRALVLLIAALGILSAPAFAQSPYPPGPPPPVPALPDSPRLTTYTITGTTCACAVGFNLYGDGTDYQNWVEVWLNGAKVPYNDATFGWTITSPTGGFTTIPRPITDAVLTFNNAQTGTVQIVGAQRPRRLTEFSENRGVAARDLNQAFNSFTAIQRETWDRTADVAGRALLAPPGETIGVLPKQSARAGGFLVFDGSGNPTTTSPTPGLGNVVGPNSSTDGSISCFNGTTGTLLKVCATAYAPLNSPGFTGTPTAPTPGSNINTTQIPTTAWVNSYYAPKASPTFTGTVTLPVTGSAQCLQANSSGVLSGSGASCGQAIAHVELNDCMNSYYGAGSWTHYTTQGTGTDIEPALDACLVALRSSFGRGTVHVSPGLWALKTAIPCGDLSGNYIVGDGSQHSDIVVQMSTSAAFCFSAAGGFTSGGLKGLTINLDSGLGTTSTIAILLQGNATYQPDQSFFEDLYVTSVGAASYWGKCFQADGSARTSPQGIRVVSIHNLQCFNSSSLAIFISNAVQWDIDNVGTYTGTGATGNDFYISGGGTALTNSTQVTIERVVVGGTMFMQNSSVVHLNGLATTCTMTSTATYYNGWMHCTASGTIGSGSNLTIQP